MTRDSRRSVFLLTTDFKPMVGGIAEYLHSLWDEVARYHEVTILTPVDPAGNTWQHKYRLEHLPEVPARQLGERRGDRFPPLRKLNTARYFYSLHRYAADVVDSIPISSQNPAEIVIGLWDTASHFWCCALRRAGLGYSLHTYGAELVQPLYGKLPIWRKEDIEKAKQIITCSQATAGLLHSYVHSDTRVNVVTPGVGSRPDQNDAKSHGERLRSELGISSGKVLLTIARLIPRKGIDLVVRCLPELMFQFPDIQYLIAGEGPAREHLQKLASSLRLGNSVRLLGHVDEVTKWGLYELCDIFVMPNRLMSGSDWEGFGMVFLEAALLGKPAVGGNNGGSPDAIVDGITGLLVNPEDPRMLIAALSRLLADAHLRHEMGMMAERRAKAQFGWEVIASDFLRTQDWN